MEYEKIKIYVTKRVSEVLNKDAEIFDFVKRDGVTINKNAFLSALIVNYWKMFNEKQKSLKDSVRLILKNNLYIKDTDVSYISDLITNKINKDFATDVIDKFDTQVSFKPTKMTIDIVDYINEFLLENSSLSEYFRNMFTAYSSLPQDMREQIIFKQNYELISTAINSKKQIFITLSGRKHTTMQITPHSFSRSKEEIHIYLIYKDKEQCRSIKLSKIQSVTILDKPAYFEVKDEELVKKMQKYGVQFSYFYNEQPIIVRLTSHGKLLYKRMYIHRPIPDQVADDVYTFRCSNQQVIMYFTRFGGDVEIISPDYAKQALYDFHNAYIKHNPKN